MNFHTCAKKSFAALLVASLVFGISACQGGGGTSSEASEGAASQAASGGKAVTLEFQQWWEEELPSGSLRKICDQFTKDTNINIKLLSNPYADTKTQIAAGAAAGTMADVVGLDGSWVYDFAKQGSIANLSDLMKQDNYDTAQLASQIQVDGKAYMIPVVNFAYPMYVNLDLLKSAGISELPKTWAEFKDDCVAVKKKNPQASGWIIQLSDNSPSGIQNCLMSWLWASGGNMLNNGKPSLTNNEKMTKTVDFVKSLFDAGVVASGATSMTEADMTENFINGRVAFMTDSLAHLVTIKKENPKLNFTTMGVPKMEGYTGKSGMDVANWGIGVSANPEHPREAMKFIEYLMSPEVNAQLAVLANAFPGSAKAEPDYSKADKLFSQTYDIYKAGYGINEFTGIPTSEDLMRSYSKQFQLYLKGEIKSADEMLANVQNEWEKAFQ
ncbi:MAG TPA: sugar ABC transporter substrate-binding protein [Ruminococcaceae bacterium]|nr:sugar ABC transporter substrate-binding protein [Oscillospiraceae bacterium]